MANTSLQTLNITLPLGSIDSYIAQVNRIALLSQEEEYEYAIRLQKQGDLSAAQSLVMSHLRYVVKIAKSYSGYGLALADLIQEGNVGLMKAVKRFNPEIGVRLVSFAVHWIKAEIHDFVLRNWRIVKVATTKSQRKLFFNLRQAKSRLGWFTAEEVNDVAKDLGVQPKVVREMEMRLNAHDASFDGYSDDDDDDISAPVHYLEDQHYNPATLIENDMDINQGKADVHQALADLDERSQDIIEGRWLTEQKVTLQELADKYHISAERVRQLEKIAMQKLQQVLQKHQASH